MRHARGAVISAVVVIVVASVTEVGLRVFPGVVPHALLKEFQPDLRLEVATSLHLKSHTQMRDIPRDDGGAPLPVFKPNTKIAYWPHDSTDPVTVTLDDNGFCNPDAKTPDKTKIDIVTLGDSFTACTATPPGEGWPARLGAMLGRSVYNLGQSGVGPYEYIQILIDFGLARHPDTVIMNIQEGNDLRDSVLHLHYVAAAKEGRHLFERADERRQGPDYGDWLSNPIGRSSYAWNLLVTGFHQAYEGLDTGLKILEGRQPPSPDFRYTLAFPGQDVPFNVKNRDDSEVDYARLLRAGIVQTSAFDGALERFVALAQEWHFQPVVAYSPSAYSAYTAYVHFEDPALAPLLRHYHATLEAYFAAKAKELGYLFVDLTPALQIAAAETQARKLLYFPANTHYTEEGQHVVAETLAQALAPQTAFH